MYEITVSRQFAAAHAIRLHDGTLEPLHEHNWTVHVTVTAEQLDAIDVVMDFQPLEKLVDAVIARVHNRNLNDVGPFADGCGENTINPTAERVAWWFGTEVARSLPARVRLTGVKVGEAPGCTATYRP
ncbi:MAG: 6-carboxytetrahydropterin synthase [Phycisphaeraceae bacterium]